MPRKFNKRRFYRKGKKYANKAIARGGGWSTVGKIARTALKIGKFVSSVINPEFKWCDDAGTFSSIDANGAGTDTCTLITNIAQGSSSQQRIGQSVLSKGLDMRLTFNINPAVGGGGNTHVRCIVFIDTNPSARTSLLVNDVLQLGTNYQSTYNMNFPSRYVTIMDRIIDLGYSNETKTIKIHKTFGPSDKGVDHPKWDTTTGGGIADVRENHIFLLLISDQATNTPSCNYYFRYRYIDN